MLWAASTVLFDFSFVQDPRGARTFRLVFEHINVSRNQVLVVINDRLWMELFELSHFREQDFHV